MEIIRVAALPKIMTEVVELAQEMVLAKAVGQEVELGQVQVVELDLERVVVLDQE